MSSFLLFLLFSHLQVFPHFLSFLNAHRSLSLSSVCSEYRFSLNTMFFFCCYFGIGELLVCTHTHTHETRAAVAATTNEQHTHTHNLYILYILYIISMPGFLFQGKFHLSPASLYRFNNKPSKYFLFGIPD